MDPTDLWRPILLYGCFLGPLTAGAVYLATYSALVMLGLAAAGLLLAALGGGTAGVADGGGVEAADGDGVVMEATGLVPTALTDTSLRLTLLFYGTGVLVSSLVVVFTLRDAVA